MQNEEYNQKLEMFASMALQGILAGDGAKYSTRESNVNSAISYAKELLERLEQEYKQ